MATGIYPFEHGITGNDVDGKNQRAELDVPMREAFHKHPSFIRMLDGERLPHPPVRQVVGGVL